VCHNFVKLADNPCNYTNLDPILDSGELTKVNR
jgi:hypothetical protein